MGGFAMSPMQTLGSLAIAAAALSGCGTYVPEIQEFPLTPLQGQELVSTIAFNVTCEVRDAIIQIYQDYPQGTFLDKWGAQITLNITTEEKSSANPTANWTPPSPATAVFNLGLSGTASADATRIDKVSWSMAVADVRGRIPCGDKRPQGVMLLQSDLKLKEWLYDAIDMQSSRYADFTQDTPDGPFKQQVLSHEVKFDIETSAGIVPGWKLTRVAINQSGTGLSASRGRIHDLTITLGPIAAQKTVAKDKNGHVKKDQNGRPIYITNYVFIQPASDAHQAAQIGLAVANAIRASSPQQ
jgi:hypothetical protein